MDPIIKVNERVDVVVIFRKAGEINTFACPHKMIYRGREIIFSSLAMLHPTSQGKRMIHVFDMTDGANDYCLEFDAERLIWTLKSILPGDF